MTFYAERTQPPLRTAILTQPPVTVYSKHMRFKTPNTFVIGHLLFGRSFTAAVGHIHIYVKHLI